jgi:hypothetical protein
VILNRADVIALTRRYFQHDLRQFDCTISRIAEAATYWVVWYEMKWLDHPEAETIVDCWIIFEKETGLGYLGRTRTRLSDLEGFPANRDMLISFDPNHFPDLHS